MRCLRRIQVLALGADRSGGAEVYTYELVRRLVLRGHQVTLITHQAGTDLDGIVEVRIIPRPANSRLPVVWRLSPLLRLAEYCHLIAGAGLGDPELIIGSSQQMIWAHRKAIKRTPFIYLPHSLVASQEIPTYSDASFVQRNLTCRVFDEIERWALNHADRTVRFTHAGCEALAMHYGSRISPRFEVIPPPVDLLDDLTVGLSDRTNKADCSEVNLLSVGRLVGSKNILFLLHLLARLTHLSWRLDVVGDGVERRQLENEVRRLSLSDRIQFHGHQQDVGPWYRAANLLVFPSRLESAGLVLLEAMSYRVPALCIRADGARYRNVNHELLRDGYDGFIAENEEHFGRRLAELIASPETLPSVGDCARLTVEQRHGWDAHVDRIEESINEILESRKVRDKR